MGDELDRFGAGYERYRPLFAKAGSGSLSLC